MIDKKYIKEAEETPESECFDCKDFARIMSVCPAHAELRKRKLNKEA